MDFGKQLAKESRFSGAAGACHNNRGEVPGRFSDHIIQISRYVSHVSILRYYFRIINNKGFNLSGIIGVSASARDRFRIADNSWTWTLQWFTSCLSRLKPGRQHARIGSAAAMFRTIE